MNRSYPLISLGEIAEKIDYGLTASAKNLGEGPKFLRITDIQNDSVDWKTVPICECTEEDCIKYAIKPGDIVFARTGATTGKSFLVNSCPLGAVFASYLIRVRPSSCVDPAYLSHFFHTPHYWHQITKSSTGTAQAGVNASNLKKLSVPLPPLEEQQRIAAILDKADAVRKKRSHAIQLTEELLRATFLDMFGDPATNPKGWDMANLGELLAEPLQNGAYFQKDCYVQDGNGVEMIHMSDSFYGIVKRGNLKRVNATQVDIEKYGLNTNDVIITRRSLNYEGSAKPCLIPHGQEPLIFESSLIRVRVNQKMLDPIFFFSYMLQPEARKAFVFPHVTKSTISGINQAGLQRVKVLLPPIFIQTRYRKLYEKVTSLVSHYQKNLEQSENLFNTLLHRAFTGEL